MTPEEQNKENLRKKIHLGIDDAFNQMSGYEDFGGKIIVAIEKPILLEKRTVKVTYFGESIGKV